MATLGLWPATIPVSYCNLRQRVSQIQTGEDSEQVIDRLKDKWLMSLTLPPRKFLKAGELDGFIERFRGRVHWIKAWHFGRPKPRGTLAGAPTLNVTAAFMADELRISTTPFATLFRGDMLGTGGLLHMAADDCVASAGGLLIVPLVNRVRIAQAAGTAVEWSKPCANFRLVSSNGVGYVPGHTEPVTLELEEKVG